MLVIRKLEDVPLSVGVFSECFDVEQILHEARRAYASGDMQPGISRLFLVDPGTECDELNVRALSEIRDEMRSLEQSGEAMPRFLSLFAVAEQMHALAVEAYKIMWKLEARGADMPAFRTVRTFGEAAFILERSVDLPAGGLATVLVRLGLRFPSFELDKAG